MKSRITILGIMAFLMAALLLSGCANLIGMPQNSQRQAQPAAHTASEGYSTYTSYQYDLRMDYPSDWVKREGFMGTIVVFMAPTEGMEDGSPANMNVLMQDITFQTMTLDDYTELSIEQLESFITDFDLIEEDDITLAGAPAKKLVYTGEQGVFEIKWVQVWGIKDSKVYVLTFTTHEDRFNEFSGIADEMIDSFEVLG